MDWMSDIRAQIGRRLRKTDLKLPKGRTGGFEKGWVPHLLVLRRLCCGG